MSSNCKLFVRQFKLKLSCLLVVMHQLGQVQSQVSNCEWDLENCQPNRVGFDVLLRLSEDPFARFWGCQLQTTDGLCSDPLGYCQWDTNTQTCNINYDIFLDVVNSCIDGETSCETVTSDQYLCPMPEQIFSSGSVCPISEVKNSKSQKPLICSTIASLLDCISAEEFDNGTRCDSECYVEYEFFTGACEDIVETCAKRFTQFDAAVTYLSFYQTQEQLNHTSSDTLTWQPVKPGLLAQLLFPEKLFSQQQFIDFHSCYSKTTQFECTGSNVSTSPPPPPPPPPSPQYNIQNTTPESIIVPDSNKQVIDAVQQEIDDLQNQGDQANDVPDKQWAWIIVGGVILLLVTVGALIGIVFAMLCIGTGQNREEQEQGDIEQSSTQGEIRQSQKDIEQNGTEQNKFKLASVQEAEEQPPDQQVESDVQVVSSE